LYESKFVVLSISDYEMRWLTLQINAGSNVDLVSERSRQPIQPNVVEFDAETRQFIVRNYWQTVGTRDNYMWSLPSHFLDNKVWLWCNICLQ